MIHPLHLRNRIQHLARHLSREDHAAQLVEFAVALPLLVVFVVGIFDFSGAFTLKQKLTNIARDAARAAASEPATDLCQTCASGLPASVNDSFQLVFNYLQTNNLDNCGISSALYTSGPGPSWVFQGTSSSCGAGGLKVVINRAYYFPAGTTTQPANATCTSAQGGANQLQVVSTCVSIQYAYRWRFGRVASVLGANQGLPASITAVSVAMNEN